ncbi:TraR/DksA family transcriptional regulator [Longimicrobium terrae]|jgi:DnaK suppressor protein|uniref:DnaK suppressor protein n=1 Tax=Longimicrobium terrae TaxID=1639882 RepID=A0A841GZM2_9BACT|nr:TraR/DksA C4-type zinc finger protein [Longimicrobium terrae]MBB4636824.1 DnaK suppressor protein [Longimicrobium terrae]MBB6071176.1 DnaK suppressor protein [Longimicrobium terrae]NNC29225.1 TraR/DksA family transcriptional regulator [Longimicrobium terrae]
MTVVEQLLAPAQRDMIRDELLRSLCKLERSLKASGEAARPRDLEQDTVGRLSRIEALQNAGFTKKLEAREQAQLEQIVAALHRLEEGSYGSCNGCGAPIPFERLSIFPETLACSTCTRGG